MSKLRVAVLGLDLSVGAVQVAQRTLGFPIDSCSLNALSGFSRRGQSGRDHAETGVT